MTNTARHAQRELEILSQNALEPDNRPIIEEFKDEIIALCEKFGNSGQSGGSAPYTASAISMAIKKLLLFETISPITGEDDEWVDVSSNNDGKEWYQNKRESGIFKDSKDGRAYYIDAVIKQEENGSRWNGQFLDKDFNTIGSKHYIKSFPFEPKSFYIDVIEEILPEDWEQEPFIEHASTYSQKEFEETGVKNWKKHKSRYIIKDQKQLDEAFEYYDRFDK